MSPKFGQPKKEEPRVARVAVNFTVDEKEKLDRYCERENIKLSELCRREVLRVIKYEKRTEQDIEMQKLRREAEKHSLKISKGYQKVDGQYVRDENGDRIVGYMIADNQNNIMDGETENEQFLMNLEAVNIYMTTQQENYIESKVLEYREYLDEKSLEWIEDSVRDALEIEEQKEEERLEELVAMQDSEALYGAARTSYMKKFLKDKEKELYKEYKAEADEENDKKAEEYRQELIAEYNE
jgi:hypothetical protein